MNSKKWIWMTLLGAAVMSHSKLAAETNVFTNLQGDGDWTNPLNWDSQQIPGRTNVVRFMRGAEAKLTTAVFIGALQMGASGSCSMTIDGGSLTTTSPTDWNAVGYLSPTCSLTIQNGGSATFSKNFIVGRKDCRGISVVIHKGTLRVMGLYAQNRDYAGTEPISTRTTINTDGLLDIEKLILDGGVIDISGGTVIVRQGLEVEINQLIEKGRIIAMGGLDGWKVKITVSEETGWTSLTAEQEEIVLGKLPSGSATKNQQVSLVKG